MGKLIEYTENLPATIKDLQKYVAVGRRKYQAHLAAIRAINDIGAAEETRQQLLEQTQEELTRTWIAHARLGELLGIPKEGGDKKSQQYKNHLQDITSDFSPNDLRFARGFYDALRADLVENLILKMQKGNKTMPYYAPYNALMALRRKENKIELPLPPGRYSVIHIDPPWPIGSMVLDEKKWKQDLDGDKYVPLPLDEIKNLDIPSIAATDCSLFLWTTHRFLPDAFSIMKGWGFTYHVEITWDKGGGFTHKGFHRRTEPCLYGYCGKMNIEETGEAIPTLIQEPKREHSRKPDRLFTLIEQKIKGPRIDMFARTPREGWDTWGNEA